MIYVLNTFVFYFWTFQKKCPFALKLRTSQDSEKLVATSLIDKHNHAVYEVIRWFSVISFSFKLSVFPKYFSPQGPQKPMHKNQGVILRNKTDSKCKLDTSNK